MQVYQAISALNFSKTLPTFGATWHDVGSGCYLASIPNATNQIHVRITFNWHATVAARSYFTILRNGVSVLNGTTIADQAMTTYLTQGETYMTTMLNFVDTPGPGVFTYSIGAYAAGLVELSSGSRCIASATVFGG